eukprot:323494-Amphidinium_carterae.1
MESSRGVEEVVLADVPNVVLKQSNQSDLSACARKAQGNKWIKKKEGRDLKVVTACIFSLLRPILIGQCSARSATARVIERSQKLVTHTHTHSDTMMGTRLRLRMCLRLCATCSGFEDEQSEAAADFGELHPHGFSTSDGGCWLCVECLVQC